MKNPIPLFRLVALAEAVSFLVLLGIAMPLKYIWHLPIAVRITGSLHGALFLLFCLMLVRAWRTARWANSRAALLLAASIIPFAPFLLDRRMHLWAAEFDDNPPAV